MRPGVLKHSLVGAAGGKSWAVLTFSVIIHGMANLELTSCQWHKILTFRRSRSDLYVGR